MKNIFKYSPGFLAGVILSSAFAGAAAANSNLITNTIDELWVFVSGDPVLASQVNENFEYLEIKIDEEVSFLSDDVIANTVSILNNEDGVGVNQSAISQVDSSLSSFQSSQSVRDGDQDVLIADNGSRITNLESGSGNNGLFYPSDLMSYDWDVAFTQVVGTGAPVPDFLYPLSFEVTNGVWETVPNRMTWESSADYEPLDQMVSLTPNAVNTQIRVHSLNFTSDGLLRYLGLRYSANGSTLILTGVMSQSKDAISGHYALKYVGLLYSEGTFVATKQ